MVNAAKRLRLLNNKKKIKRAATGGNSSPGAMQPVGWARADCGSGKRVGPHTNGEGNLWRLYFMGGE